MKDGLACADRRLHARAAAEAPVPLFQAETLEGSAKTAQNFAHRWRMAPRLPVCFHGCCYSGVYRRSKASVFIDAILPTTVTVLYRWVRSARAANKGGAYRIACRGSAPPAFSAGFFFPWPWGLL